MLEMAGKALVAQSAGNLGSSALPSEEVPPLRERGPEHPPGARL